MQIVQLASNPATGDKSEVTPSAAPESPNQVMGTNIRGAIICVAATAAPMERSVLNAAAQGTVYVIVSTHRACYSHDSKETLALIEVNYGYKARRVNTNTYT